MTCRGHSDCVPSSCPSFWTGFQSAVAAGDRQARIGIRRRAPRGTVMAGIRDQATSRSRRPEEPFERVFELRHRFGAGLPTPGSRRLVRSPRSSAVPPSSTGCFTWSGSMVRVLIGRPDIRQGLASRARQRHLTEGGVALGRRLRGVLTFLLTFGVSLGPLESSSVHFMVCACC